MKKIEDRNELLYLVKKICNGKYTTEEQRDSMVDLFEYNVPDPEAADLIFHHIPELTPEEIVEKALSYKPLITSNLYKKMNLTLTKFYHYRKYALAR